MPQFNQPLVSIITVVYNNSTHIRGAIESVLSQDYPRIEHIVIDGGSTDGTVKIIEEKLSHISNPITLSILGCVVNGPGEAKYSNIGIAGGGKKYNQVYIDGKQHHRMKQTNFINHVVELVEEYIKNGIKEK